MPKPSCEHCGGPTVEIWGLAPSLPLVGTVSGTFHVCAAQLRAAAGRAKRAS